GTSFSYTLNNDTFKKKDKSKKKQETESDLDTENTNERRKGKKKTEDKEDFDKDGYEKWEFPWSVSFNYGINYSYGKFNKEKMDYDGKITQNLSVSGSVRPTKNWSFNFSTSFDFETKKFNYMNCSISRDLHCFTMSASFVPLGPYKSYNFHIAVKSSLLSDLKWDKQSSSSNGITWY
ncbi:MAG: LPS-assembly protein LptD, partial [Bacteroidaceae bacterium]|nr:LPS-assembly protein LptD [Bacteroidaceae bacterium]